MVRHHVKNKNKKRSAQKKEAQPPTEEEILKNLDRFAGSSEEEESDEEQGSINQNSDDTDDELIFDPAETSGMNRFETMDGEEADEEDSNHDDDDNSVSSSDDDEYGQSTMRQVRSRQITKPKKSKTDTDEDSEEDDEEEDNLMMAESGEIPTGQAGMAGAMAKILGFSAPTKKNTKAVVLSKTVTPLQKQQKKEKEAIDSLKLKRKQRREVNLTAMHIPLSAATSRPIIGKGDDQSDLIAKAMAQEIQQESMHRRVATRGVVALFNTIAKHQQQRAQQQAESSVISKKSNEQVQSMSKHGFLDMLKKTGTGTQESTTDSSSKSKTGERSNSKASPTGWNALKDDFMMNSKLKDWDKALSSDDDSDEEENTEGIKRGADVDDLMDDDWSSDDGVDSSSKRRKIKN